MSYIPKNLPILVSLPSGRIAAVKNTILQVLSNDNALSSVNLKITTYADGYDESNSVKQEPDDSELPYLRLAIMGGPMKWEHEHGHKIEFVLQFTLFTKGFNEDDMTNLMEAVFQAMYPQDPTNRAAVMLLFRSLPGLQRGNLKDAMKGFATIGPSLRGLKSTFQLSVSQVINT